MLRDFDHDRRPLDRGGQERDVGGRGAATDLREHARTTDVRDVFVRGLDAPRGQVRERISVREREYVLRRSEVRTIAAVGAFRVVPAHYLGDTFDRPGNPRQGELSRLREQGLIECRPYATQRERLTLVTLTERGRALLEASRDPSSDVRQAFYAGVVKARELGHDAQVYEAYARAAERLLADGACIRRVVLDYELKADYQRFLHRDEQPVDEPVYLETPQDWAAAHGLPYFDDQVHFPDVRIEYERPDGRLAAEDVEVMTPHYRGAFAAAKGRAGFTQYRGVTMARLGVRTTGRGGRGVDPRLAEEWL